MRYWISRTEGNVEGPFDEAELQTMLAEGSINLETQACAENTENWQTLGSIHGFGGGGAVAIPSEMGFARSQKYSFSEAFNLGWQIFTKRYGIVLGVTLFSVLASIIPTLCTMPVAMVGAGQTQGGQSGGAEFAFLQLFANCFSWAWGFLVTTPLSIGVVWVLVRILRGHADTTFNEIFTPFKRYGWVLLTILLAYACFLGIFLIGAIIGGVPGVLVGLGVGSIFGDPGAGTIVGVIVGGVLFLVVLYYLIVRISLMFLLIIDPEAGLPNSADALVSSWTRTKNCGWSLLGLMIVISMIITASVFACLLPVFFFGLPLYNAVIAGAYVLLVPSASMHCRSCGYVRGPGSKGNCPECGAPWDVEEVTA